MNTVVYLGPAQALEVAESVLGPRWSVIAPELSSQAVTTVLGDAVAIVDASMRVRFDRAMINRAPRLRVISTATTGADHIDAEFLKERRIPLLTLAGERKFLQRLTPAAEHSWLLLMACSRRLREAIQHVLDGQWERENFPGIMLQGKTLGLIGCGRIGSWMARYACAFGMNVIGHDPHIQAWPAEIAKQDLEVVLATADFVSIHVPLNTETKGMVGTRELSLMKAGAILINTSRGSIIDDRALLKALQQGHVGAAGLDVLDGEPTIEQHPLVAYARQHRNLVITPHIAGFCPEAVGLAVAYAARRVARFLSELEQDSSLSAMRMRG